MSAITVCATGIIASVLAIVLKKNNAEYSFILTVCSSAIIVSCITGVLSETISGINDVFSASGMSESYLAVLLKCVGICFLTEFTCDTCKDAGQAALSNIVLFSGRIMILFSALPLFSKLLDMVTKLTGG